jgi:MoxR-like ATPase
MAILKIKAGSGKELTYRLPNIPIRIGRNPSCQIRLAHERVSRDHAQIEPTPDGFVVTDLNSGNGTLVNGNRIQRKLLVPGDEISIAGVSLVFEPAEPAAPAPEATEAAEAAEIEKAAEVAAIAQAEPGGEVGIDERAVQNMKKASTAIRAEVGKIIVGQFEVLDQVLAAMLSRGHCLMVGVPGLAKTLIVRTIAQILDLDFKRVQFTPDLMPSDITGTDILEVDESGGKNFRFIKGPIFTNMLLADEINRTPPKTQAALLEAMQEYHVTASGYTYDLEPPFFVLATQNPLEQEGTYPLPEAQLDRFMFNVLVDYPTEGEEEMIVKRTTYRKMAEPRKVLSRADILLLQRIVWRVPVPDSVIRYAVALARASRPREGALDFVNQRVLCGAGPRACQYLILGAKARAVLDGRLEASADDVRACAIPVMRHRIFVNFNALSEGVSPTDIVRELVKSVQPPVERAPIVHVHSPTAPTLEKEMGLSGEAPSEEKLDLDSIRRMRIASAKIRDQVQKVIIGQSEVLDQVLMAMISRGHCLMVGVPGLAKTLIVRTIASVLDLDFKRVQFTPDLMPSDITGTDILEEDEKTGEKSFRFIRGPIFTNMLLADEINRTPPKTQAALLEAMQEYSVTASGKTYPLDLPFFVLATQNPLEQEGTYPLPEAQLDRFMFNIWVDYPDEPAENVIVKETTQLKKLQPQKVIGKEEILILQDIVRRVPVSDHVVKYATRLARATRPETPGSPKFISDWVYCGAGPRACQYLILGAKARAVLDGRANVSCNDVRSAALPVMRHRIFTNFNADSEGITTVEIIKRVLEAVPEPGEKDYVPADKAKAAPKRRPEAALSFSPSAEPDSSSLSPRERAGVRAEEFSEPAPAAVAEREKKIEAAPAAISKIERPKTSDQALPQGEWADAGALPEGEVIDESEKPDAARRPGRFLRRHRPRH